MELWIRSSDKERLLKANKIKYEHYKPFFSDYYIEVININDDLIEEYKTKERALEVLDEIQRLIEDLQHMSYAIPNDKFTGYRPNVYQMPEE